MYSAELPRIADAGQGVIVGDEVEGVVAVLKGDVLPERAEVVADVKGPEGWIPDKTRMFQALSRFDRYPCTCSLRPALPRSWRTTNAREQSIGSKRAHQLAGRGSDQSTRLLHDRPRRARCVE